MKNESRRTQAKNFRNRFSAWDSVHARVRERVEWVCNANVRWTWKLKDFYLTPECIQCGKGKRERNFLFFPEKFSHQTFFYILSFALNNGGGSMKERYLMFDSAFHPIVCVFALDMSSSSQHWTHISTADSRLKLRHIWSVTSHIPAPFQPSAWHMSSLWCDITHAPCASEMCVTCVANIQQTSKDFLSSRFLTYDWKKVTLREEEWWHMKYASCNMRKILN